MKNFKTIILGGGASGCMAALRAKEKDIAIIDGGTQLAKKLLVTGNGKCNITNLDIDFQPNQKFYNQDLQKYFYEFNVKDTLNFFAHLGLEVVSDEQDRVYPISKTAVSVQDVLIREIEKKDINVFLEQKVVALKKENNKFLIKTATNDFSCNKLVFCLGGQGIELLKDLQVSIKEKHPSLCALKTSKNKNLAGRRLEDVLVTAKDKNGNVFSEMGEVLFKEDGLSGIVIFNLSSLFARQGVFEGEVSIDMLPNFTHKELEEKLLARRTLNVGVSQFFVGLLANAFAYLIFDKCNTNEQRNSKELTEKEIKEFVKVIKALKFNVTGYYDNNQVFSGGALLSTLDENCQSKEVENLYICGEACDVDGVCGGYNLQWAWTSGFIAGGQI